MNSKLYCINPNTKEYEEVKTIYGIDIEEVLDLIRDYKMSKDLKFDKFGKLEEIERLTKELVKYDETLVYVNNTKDKEIERLNNIIEKLRKVLYKRQLDDYDTYTANVVCDMQADFEEILEEGDKE